MIEPGQKFTIEYGDGHVLEVTALAGRKQSMLAAAISKAAEAEASQDIQQLFNAAFESLCLCVGEESANALWDEHVDAELAMEIAGKTLGKQALSDEQKKSSESPHSSGEVNFADSVETTASTITGVA